VTTVTPDRPASGKDPFGLLAGVVLLQASEHVVVPSEGIEDPRPSQCKIHHAANHPRGEEPRPCPLAMVPVVIEESHELFAPELPTQPTPPPHTGEPSGPESGGRHFLDAREHEPCLRVRSDSAGAHLIAPFSM
jgi:hypothetical protein